MLVISMTESQEERGIHPPMNQSERMLWAAGESAMRLIYGAAG
jgi:hypothetical protein